MLRRHNPSYTSGINSFTPTLQLADQARQLEEIVRSEVRPPGRQGQKRIVAKDVGPGRRHRAYSRLSWFSEEHAVFAPGVAKADQFVFVAAQRMERVRYTESLRILATTGS
jgi:hypothetical protein